MINWYEAVKDLRGQSERQIEQTNKPVNGLYIWSFTASKMYLLALIFVSYSLKDDGKTTWVARDGDFIKSSRFLNV